MLFTTATFTFAFLPLVLLGFYLCAGRSRQLAAYWLVASSIFFYGYWMPQFTALLVCSVLVNFLVGRQISACMRPDSRARGRARTWMIAGIVFNLTLLGYFKYANFFLDTLQTLLGVHIQFARIVLPIGISFFTFTQIAFLADAYQKGVQEYKLAHYGLFVTYFPHLVAGPVLHHSQMMPQFARAETYSFRLANFAAGVAIFGLGLLKKVVIADGVSPYANAVFDGANGGTIPTFGEAWLGSFAYTFQLYFDFSGYSDMAIGLSWMLNVRLPFNFDSPYKARNITDFWRRWHMTLSAFLRDYLYIPLGGNRRGAVRRYLNLATTMLLGGLWHGASWTFVLWGGLHGAYLGVNHAFRSLVSRSTLTLDANRIYRAASWLLTLLAVVIAWVFFRAPTFESAVRILRAMTNVAPTGSPAYMDPLLWNAGLRRSTGLLICAILALIALFAPNSNTIGERLHTQCLRGSRRSSFTLGVAVTIVVFLIVVNESRDTVSAFIYFNF
jgi:alginate O-acetyltransferase complex protein AlgI